MMTAEEIGAFLETAPDAVVAGDVMPSSLRGGVADEEIQVSYDSGLLRCARNDEDLSTLATLAAEADPADPQFLPRPLYIRAPDVTVARASPLLTASQ